MDTIKPIHPYKELKHLLELNRISLINLQPVIHELLNSRSDFKSIEVSSIDKESFVVDANLGMPLAILFEEILLYFNSIAAKPNDISLHMEFATNTVQLFIYTDKKVLALDWKKEQSDRISLIWALLEEMSAEVSYSDDELCYKISFSSMKNRHVKVKRVKVAV